MHTSHICTSVYETVMFDNKFTDLNVNLHFKQYFKQYAMGVPLGLHCWLDYLNMDICMK